MAQETYKANGNNTGYRSSYSFLQIQFDDRIEKRNKYNSPSNTKETGDPSSEQSYKN